MEGTRGDKIRDQSAEPLFGNERPKSAAVITDRLMAEFTTDAAGGIRTTERRLRNIVAQAVELGAMQRAAAIAGANAQRTRQVETAWPSPRRREGLRRLYVAAACAWAVVLLVIVLEIATSNQSVTAGQAAGMWLLGFGVPALAVFAGYRAVAWIARGFQDGPADPK
ncbi:hypothetical protein [Neoroseomonas oryzicola]|uniref:Uncharacterized protein n=1 Tax=Neoroseomonas oryzicola TaxID=535904 RepID=A0A9X9WLI7_9PROT|nr:hypothetical protein [Neoroseomonas oryzicola]MBR0661197.1 hypothetical protein [Neoroseomonas oryzicola]NKE17562.1 hypothetical protein [Neoroseomonas oryzicola]